ncbi:hypothetical protein NC653_040142 [Populus alba x Populus x berolinensis]|uniref:Uncharacterized protein n=1 Tax=Populus alba x Populus x berolinensis TaxID=444605 RepID=A0AAD6LFK3_9ROSI|nr:hypothetical protein NC653_040142 [Populus alba x Populus x berolinensis]
MDIGLDAKRKIMTEVIMHHTWSYYRHKPVTDLTRKTTNYGQPRDHLQTFMCYYVGHVIFYVYSIAIG